MNRTLCAQKASCCKVAILLTALSLAGAVLAASEEKRELLAEHETVAQFQELAYRECMGMTSECPDRCGNSGEFANFTILKYMAYRKPGKYGDAKTERFSFQVNDNMLNQKIPLRTSDTVRTLTKDDYVLLSWRHDYVTKNGGSAPERTITVLRKLTPEAAEKTLAETSTPEP